MGEYRCAENSKRGISTHCSPILVWGTFQWVVQGLAAALRRRGSQFCRSRVRPYSSPARPFFFECHVVGPVSRCLFLFQRPGRSGISRAWSLGGSSGALVRFLLRSGLLSCGVVVRSSARLARGRTLASEQ